MDAEIRWIVLDVGCLECSWGGDSVVTLVGTYATEAEALAKQAELDEGRTDQEIAVLPISAPSVEVSR